MNIIFIILFLIQNTKVQLRLQKFKFLENR
jgi:hypothetical protein